MRDRRTESGCSGIRHHVPNTPHSDKRFLLLLVALSSSSRFQPTASPVRVKGAIQNSFCSSSAHFITAVQILRHVKTEKEKIIPYDNGCIRPRNTPCEEEVIVLPVRGDPQKRPEVLFRGGARSVFVAL